MQPCNRSRYLAVGVAILILGFSFVVVAAPISVSDDRGIVVVFDKPPQRIVSLLPSLTESVCALGKCGTLVGVDRFSNWPKSIQALPKLGGIGDINIEQIEINAYNTIIKIPEKIIEFIIGRKTISH